MRIWALGFGRLMRHGRPRHLRSISLVSSRSGLEFPPVLRASRLRMADIRPVHLGDRGFDEAERFGKILRQLFVGGPLRTGFGAIGRILGPTAPAIRRGASEAMRPEGIAAQFLEARW